MPYVSRNQAGQIDGLYGRRQSFADEKLPDDHAEVVAYRGRIAAPDVSGEALKALHLIDLRSIRALREYIAARPDATQTVKDREAEAVAERAKLGGGR